MKNKIRLSLLLASLISSLHAQSTIILQPLPINSTIIKADELTSTDAIEIYTSQDIQKAHVQNLYQFLNQQTSVTAMPSYGNPFAQLLDMHGYGLANGNKNIVITIDGEKLNNIDSLPQLLSSISVSSIKRVEIIKSSGIVTVGDGANAGVINITTKQNSNGSEVGFYGGSYGTADGSFYVSRSNDKLAVSASGEAEKTAGSRTVDNNGNKDASKFSHGRLNISYHATQRLKLHLGAHFSKEDVFYAGYLTQAQYDANPGQQGGLSTHQLYDTNGLNGTLTYNIHDTLTLHLQAEHQKKRSEYISAYGDNVSFYNYNGAKTLLRYNSSRADLVAGVQIFYGKRRGGYYNDTMDKNNVAGYLLGRFHFKKDRFKMGYRFENVAYTYEKGAKILKKSNNLHGIEVGYNHLINKQQSLFTNYSHTYLAPVVDSFFNEYTGSFNNFISPMEANNFTIGYTNIQPINKFKLSLYYISLKNEIYYNPVTYQNTNIPRSHKYGLDLSDKYLLSSHLNLTLNYNYVQAIIDSDKGSGYDYAGKELPGVSHHSIKAIIDYLPDDKLTISLTQTYRSWAYAINDFNNDFSQRQKPYMSTDLAIDYTDKTYELFAKINNLFNQKNGLWIQNNDIYPVNFSTTVIAGLKLKF